MKTPTTDTLSRRLLLQAGSLVLLIGAHQIARGASVVAVRIWPSKDYTRLTIESDGELKVKQTANSDPSRLTVYIEGIDLLEPVRELVQDVGGRLGIVRQILGLLHVQREVFGVDPLLDPRS